MKMKLTFLLLASVFFVSCGMPTIFNPNTSEYTLVKTTPDTSNTYVQGQLSMHLDPSGPNYELLADSETKGPSLMFFYTFDNANDSYYTLTSDDISIITSKFKKEFIKNSYYGIPVDASKEILSITLHDIVNGDKEVYLYGVSPYGINNTFNARDRYVLYASDNLNQAALDFTLKKEDNPPFPNGTEYTLKLSSSNASGSPTQFISNAPLNQLYAYDGASFSLDKAIIKNKISRSSNHEYDYLGQNKSSDITVPASIRMHLFAAFFISGNFSNNFWSKLTYLGAIPITLNSDL